MELKEVYPDWNSFAEEYEKFLELNHHPVFVIQCSRSAVQHNKKHPNAAIPLACFYKYVVFACCHGQKKASTTRRIRPNQKTFKMNCTAELVVEYSNEKQGFVITKCNMSHIDKEGRPVHDVDADTFKHHLTKVGFRGTKHTICRIVEINNGEDKAWIKSKDCHRSDIVKNHVEMLLKHDASVHKIRQYFKDQTNLPISSKCLHNKKGELTKTYRQSLSANKHFLKLVNEDQKNGQVVVEKVLLNNEVQLIYIQFAWMRDLFSKYPEHILIDSTYRLLDTRMPLYTIMVVDGMNFSIPIAFCIVVQETKSLIDQFMFYFSKHNPAVDSVQSYMTDKDFNEIAVLKRHFPFAKHELCLWHVLKSMKLMVETSSIPKKSNKDIAKTLLEAMVYSHDADKFEQLAEEFVNTFDSYEISSQFIQRWYNCKHLWATYARLNTVNLGDTTNNRLESFHQKLKQYIGLYSTMDVFYKNLKLLLVHLLEKIERAKFDEKAKVAININNTTVSHDVLAEIDRNATYYSASVIKNEISFLNEKNFKVEANVPNLNEYTILSKSGSTHTTTTNSCSCYIFVSKTLPCRHIFHIRNLNHLPLFEPKMLPLRWRKEYYLKSKTSLLESLKKKLIVEDNTVQKLVQNSETVKYLRAERVCKSLSEILKTSGGETFRQTLEQLESIESDLKHKDPRGNLKIQLKDDLVGQITLQNEPEAVDSSFINVIHDHSYCETNEEKMPTPIHIRGRPKGSVLTAIGKRRVAPKPSERIKKRKVTMQIKKLPNADRCHLPIVTREKPQVWVKISGICLRNSHKAILLSNNWLDDELIDAAQCLLRNEHHDIEGLQSPVLAELKPPSFEPVNGSYFVQICHVGGNHWLCIRGQIEKDKVTVDVYDSYPGRSSYAYPEIKSIVSSLTRKCNFSKIIIIERDVCKQNNGFDCGLYAIAFSKVLCLKKNPCHIELKGESLRRHLFETFDNNSSTLTEFPYINRNVSVSGRLEVHERLHCACRKPAEPLMINCKRCAESFHRKCAKFPQATDSYFCERCKDVHSNEVPIIVD